MKVVEFTYTFLLLMVAPSLGKEETKEHQKIGNLFPNITDDQVFFPDYGVVTEVGQVKGVVRNLIAPLSAYLSLKSLKDITKTTLYFNIHNEEGENQGLYVLSEGSVKKINDGRDSAADYPRNETIDQTVYIATADGIYTYVPDTQDVKKYGNLTDDVIAIDKLSGKDLIYILCTDHKIYKVTNHGTVKEVLAGVDYAKDFVLGFTESILYIGEDNKPRFLMKDSTVPHEYKELSNYDIDDTILIRPIYNPFVSEGGQDLKDYSSLLIMDDVLWIVLENQTYPYFESCRVPNLTAFSCEFSFINFYAADGKIYVHSILAERSRDGDVKRSSKKKQDKIILYDRDVKSDYDKLKTFNLPKKN